MGGGILSNIEKTQYRKNIINDKKHEKKIFFIDYYV